MSLSPGDGGLAPEASALAVVVIGRNEGERLGVCLRSVLAACEDVVYVDSGSSDGSVGFATSLGVRIIELDPSEPFTAARARNEGIRALEARTTPPRLVQVIDGDCGLIDSWLPSAVTFLEGHPQAGLVCGRRRERHPEASIYNRLCDMEWDTPVGRTTACGGDALMRLEAFSMVGGYDPHMIAGEDPEFSHRVRMRGWEIHRIDEEMTLHDADIFSFRQWWLRAKRSGHAYAECYAMHRGDGSGFERKALCSILLWGLAVPVSSLVAILMFGIWGLAPLAGYPVLWSRVRGYRIEHGDRPRPAATYATFCVMGKFAETLGVLKYGVDRAFGKSGKLIEYKQEGLTPGSPESR